MIVEHIETFTVKQLPDIIQEALEIIRKTNFKNLEEGTYKVRGDDLFYVVQEYETLDRKSVEAELHRKYCDIQFIVSGQEAIGWASAHIKCDTGTYDTEKDIALFPAPQNETLILMETGMFVFFAPLEIHRPRLDMIEGKKSFVKKVVFKINAERL